MGGASAYRQAMSELSTLERAFALARTGSYANVSDIRTQLRAEGYYLAQLEGPSLQKQLRQICSDAKKAL